MRGFTSVYKRELKGYFATPLAYVFLVIFLLSAAAWTFLVKGFFERGQASLELFFKDMPLLLLLLVPAMAMRLWSEERRTNSIELLFTLPITATQAVLGKFFAAWTVILLALALTLPMVLTVCGLGSPDGGPIITGYLGTFLLAGGYLAIGSFFSGLTRNQVIALVFGVVACVVFLFLGTTMVLDFLSGFLPEGLVAALENLSFAIRYESIQRGVIELRDLAFFLLIPAGWLWATVVALKERMATG